MKALSKRLSMTLILLLVMSLVAACANGNNASNDDNDGSVVSNTPATTPDNEAPSTEPVSIKMFAGLYNEVPEMTNDYWVEWERMTNSKLNVEWVPSGDLNTKLDLLLASGDLPEVISMPDFKRPTLLSAIKSGAFWDLTPFLGDFSKYPNMRDNVVENAYNYRKVDGKIYSLPGSRSLIDVGIKIRKDWLDKLQIPVPTTLDEYADALEKIVNGDPDGNKRKDTLGLIGTGVIVNDGDASIAAGFGAFDPTYNDEGGMIFERFTPQYTQAVEYFKSLYDRGLLSKEFSVMKKTQAEELFQTNRAASYARSIWWDKDWENAMAKSGQPDAEIINLMLTGPGGYAIDLSHGGGGGYMISKKVPEEKVWRLLEYFELSASQEVTDLAYYGIEGVHHTTIDGQKILNEQGIIEVNTTSKNVGMLAYAPWGKVTSASGDKAYNDAKIASVEKYAEFGKINPFRYLISDAWINVWSKHEEEWKAQVTQAIVGQITMDQYKEYVNNFNNLPDTKQAYLEFAENYKAFSEN